MTKDTDRELLEKAAKAAGMEWKWTIIEMARKAGFAVNASNDPNISRFKALVELVRANEREACAKVCVGQIKIFLSPQYKTGQPMSSLGERHAVASCVEAIRARGNT